MPTGIPLNVNRKVVANVSPTFNWTGGVLLLAVMIGAAYLAKGRKREGEESQ